MSNIENEEVLEPAVLNRTLTEEEFDDLTESSDSPASVTYRTQDFDLAGLVTRLNRGSMLIPRFGDEDERVSTAGFQRGFVWNKAQMDRFIESLLLGYPVPGIFLVNQVSDNRMLVLDGQQRLVTLQRFYNGLHNGKEFTLVNVGDQFRGLTYDTLNESLKYKLDDSFMQATIVAADGSDTVNDAIYQIFERLNSGGTQLTPHEIRVALYAGPLIAYLENLNKGVSWRSLYGPKNARIRDQELIMRIVSLYLGRDIYSKPLKSFLNNFAAEHRNVTDMVRYAGDLFVSACDVLSSQVGPEALRRPGGRQVNVAQTEAVLIGTMKAVEMSRVPSDLAKRVETLKADSSFASATTRFTADTDAVNLRIESAINGLTAQ